MERRVSSMESDAAERLRFTRVQLHGNGMLDRDMLNVPLVNKIGQLEHVGWKRLLGRIDRELLHLLSTRLLLYHVITHCLGCTSHPYSNKT